MPASYPTRVAQATHPAANLTMPREVRWNQSASMGPCFSAIHSRSVIDCLDHIGVNNLGPTAPTHLDRSNRLQTSEAALRSRRSSDLPKFGSVPLGQHVRSIDLTQELRGWDHGVDLVLQ